MKHRYLHEIAKFAAGLVAGDFLSVVWLSQHTMFPATFFGIEFTADMIAPTLIFDAALFIILIHYGWHIGKIPRPRERSYLLVAGTIFTIVAVGHLLRIFFSWDLTLGLWQVPEWLSWFGVAMTAYLAYASFAIAARLK